MIKDKFGNKNISSLFKYFINIKTIFYKNKYKKIKCLFQIKLKGIIFRNRNKIFYKMQITRST